MRLHGPCALTLALLIPGAGAAVALAQTADSITAEATNSKSKRALIVVSDVSECDIDGGYGCYTASFSVHKDGKRILRRPLVFDPNTGVARTRYAWTCKHTGILVWRIRVSDGQSSATRRARFRVSRC